MFHPIESGTLLYRDSIQHHLFILLTGPCGRGKQVLLVPICTHLKSNRDTACLLDQADHKFIRHKSYVAYALCRIESADKLKRGVSSGLFEDKGILQANVFQRVLDGFDSSRFVKPFATKHWKRYQQEKQ